MLLLAPFALLGEWRSTGPFGGSAEVVRFIPNVPGTALAATRNGLIYLSNDGAKSWKLIPFAAQLAGTLHAVEVSPDAWYVGMEGNESWASGVYKSTDSGSSWKQIFKGKAIWSLAISGSMVAAGADDGVYLSTDAGLAWRRISPEENRELRPVVSLAFHPSDPNVIYAGTTHLPWRTIDGGAHWQSIHSGMLDDSDVFSIVVDRNHPEIVLSSACSGAYRSTSAGTLWARMPTPHGAFRTYFVALSPSNVIFAGTTLGLFRSLDTGKTWLKVTADSVKSISFEGSKVLMASQHGGVLFSSDGGATVKPTNEGFSNTNLGVIVAAGTILYASGGYEGLFRSQDFGSSWTHISSEHGLLLAAKPKNPSVVFAATHDTFSGSKDGGRTWLKAIPPPVKAISALIANDDGSLLAGTNAGLFRKTDTSAWAPVKFGSGMHRVQFMESAGHGRVTMVADGRAFVSENSGREWSACAAPPAGTEWYGLSMSIAGGDVLAATSHGLFRSTDRCASWSLVKDGLEAGTVNTVLFHPTREAEAYASQYGKVLRSLDGGAHWQTLDDRGKDGLYPSAFLISSGQPDRLVALFPRRGIEITTIAVDRTESPQKEKE